jgi:hypothetical protein
MSAVMKRRLAVWLPVATVMLAGVGYAAWRWRNESQGQGQSQQAA